MQLISDLEKLNEKLKQIRNRLHLSALLPQKNFIDEKQEEYRRAKTGNIGLIKDLAEWSGIAENN
jgi:hypothetical protein